MSVRQRLGALVVALFAIAFTRGPGLIRLFNPLMGPLLASRLPAGPNGLLTVRGRKTGVPRTFPVSVLELGDRYLLQAAADEVSWARNLRASGEALLTKGRRKETLSATELSPEAAGRVLHDLLASWPRSRLVRAVVGPVDRPPVGILYYFRIRVDDTLDEYVALARRQPVFELRHGRDRGSAPMSSAVVRSQ
jgi:deazaflavin-dependent oxidoreductase (nitroreductase family)